MNVRLGLIVLFAGALSVAGCASGGASAPTPANSSYVLTVGNESLPGGPLLVAQWQPATGGNAPAFFAAAFVAYVGATISPAPSSSPALTLTATSPIVSATSYPGGPGIAQLTGTAPGKGMLTISAGAPVNTSASVAVYSYSLVNFGCNFGVDVPVNPGYKFSADNSAAVQLSPQSSDLYETAGSDVNPAGNECSAGSGYAQFVGPAGSGYLDHFPNGGVLIAGSLATFPFVTASQWSNAATSIPSAQLGTGILLFKTSTGSVVKYNGTGIGIFEVTDATGNFPY